MAQTIKLKRSATAGNTPTTSQLALGELGINTTDGKLFLKKSVSGTESVVEVGSSDSLPLAGGTLTGNLSLGDNVKLQLGNQTNGDLQIYHDGSHSRIVDAGTGIMTIQASSQLGIYNADGTQVSAEFVNDGKVGLRFSGSEKLATTSTGTLTTGTSVVSTSMMIGSTDSPSRDLEIKTTNPHIRLTDTDASGSYTEIFGGSGITTINADKGQNVSGSVLKLSVDATDGITIDSNHNVSIPNGNLDVTGSVVADVSTTTPFISLGSTTNSYQTVTGSSDGNDLTYRAYQNHVFKNVTGASSSTDGTDRLKIASNGDISFYDSSGTSQNFFWDSSTSRLGLGVTNPQRTLETKGVGVLLANTGGAHEILFGDNAHRYFSLYTPSSPDSMAIRTGTTDLLTINADGSSAFSGSVTADKFKLSSTNFIDSPTTSIIRYSVGSGDHVFFSGSTSNSELLRINGSNANVNIPNGSLMVGATTAPSTKLQVNGLSDGGALNVASLMNTGTAANTSSRLLFIQGGNTTRGAYVGGLNESTSGQPTSLVFGTSASYSAPTERMRIDSSGRVGIGGASGGAILQLNNSSLSYLDIKSDNVLRTRIYNDSSQTILESTTSNLIFKSDSTERMRVTTSSGGNTAVGIGTSSPAVDLDVRSNSVSNPAFISTGNSDGSEFVTLYGGTSVDQKSAIWWDSGQSELKFGTATSKVGASESIKMTIKSTGNVNIPNGKLGIGFTTAPFTKSHIKDTAWSSGAPYGTVQLIEGNNVNDDNWGHLLITDTTTSNGNGGSIRFATGASSSLNPFAGVSGVSEGASYGGLAFYTRPSGGTATERMKIDSAGRTSFTVGTNAKGTFSDNISEVGDGNFALQATNSAGSALKPLGFRAEDIRFATGSSERMRLNSDGSCRWTPDGTNHDMTLTASGNLLVGTTSTIPFTFSSGTGAGITNGGTIMAGATAEAGLFNRVGSDGAIIQLYKAGGIVGSLGTFSQDSQSNFFIGFNNGSQDVGLGFGHSAGTGRAYYPCRDDGSGVSDAISLGTATYKYKDLYLSGTVNALVGSFGDNVSIASSGVLGVTDSDLVVYNPISGHSGLRFGAGFISPTSNSGTSTGGAVDLGQSGIRFKDLYLSGTVNAPYIGATDVGLYFNGSYNAVVPYRPDTGVAVDDYLDLGVYSHRWDDIFATNGTIQTSDRNEKQDIESLTEAEERVAVAAKGLLKKFRWKSSVAEKGDDARIHFGIIAQDLQAAFEAEGLDAGRYAMFTSDTWTDEDGEEQTRMGVRYSELLAFIISAI